jgi:hypothetical protein
MKLKMLLLAVFAAGFAASIALAGDGKKHDNGNGCSEAHVSGTIAPQSLAVTLDKDSKKAGFAAGSVVTLALGGTGQTIRVNVEACASGTGTAQVLTVRGLELKVRSTQTTTTTGTTTGKNHDDEHGDHGEHHKGGTTTAATTAATTTVATTTHAATTVATTTTAPTTTAGTTTSH